MKRPISWAVLLVVLTASHVSAYLPSTAELRRIWNRDRLLRAPVYLRYESPQAAESLEIYLRPDGLWCKRVHEQAQGDRTVWRWGLGQWSGDPTRPVESRRLTLSWDDWAFEPNIDVLLALTPATAFEERGLGRLPDGYVWIFGARHEREPGPWFGLARDPIRLRAWRSQNPRIGSVELETEPGGRYPVRIRFDRPERAPYVLNRTQAVWDPQEPGQRLDLPTGLALRPEWAVAPVYEHADPVTQPHRR